MAFVRNCVVLAFTLTTILFLAPSAGAQCSSTDLDAGNTVVLGGTQVAGYAGQIGWTRFWWPNSTQLYCEPWPNPDDWRLYFRDSFVADPANRGVIALRYQGPNSACARSSYAADYLKDGAGPYLRITTSSRAGLFRTIVCDDNDYVMVAP